MVGRCSLTLAAFTVWKSVVVAVNIVGCGPGGPVTWLFPIPPTQPLESLLTGGRQVANRVWNLQVYP